jgi:hypothetical protein
MWVRTRASSRVEANPKDVEYRLMTPADVSSATRVYKSIRVSKSTATVVPSPGIDSVGYNMDDCFGSHQSHTLPLQSSARIR